MAGQDKNKPTINVLTIAASDPSGGAGIEADLKVFAGHRVFGMTAITALTVQSSRGLHRVFPIEPDIVRQILAELAADRPLHAIKIGALAKEETVLAVAEFLSQIAQVPVVLDPVIAASSGPRLLEEAALPLLKTVLLPRITIVCPNLEEAELLADMQVRDIVEMKQAAEKIYRMGAKAVLIKGGHLPGQPVDVLYRQGQIITLTGERIPGEFHGTGCALSSAIAARLARGHDLEDAVRGAREYLRQCIVHSIPGAGSVNILGFNPE